MTGQVDPQMQQRRTTSAAWEVRDMDGLKLT